MEFPKEFARSLPSTEEIIRALGLQARRSTGSDMVPSVALFGAGVLVGAGLALLFAPSSGRELREELGERAAELKDRAASVVESTAGEAHERAS
jgi:YtxH-like protein